MSSHEADNQPSATSVAGPLQGWRIVVTRSEDRADGLVAQLRALGASPIVYPTIAFAPPADLTAFDSALHQLVAGAYDWLVLTSVTGVQVVQARLHDLNLAFDAAGAVQIAAVGPTTATACADLLGKAPAVVPEKFVAEALAEAMGDLHGQRLLLANADISRPKLQELLQAAGASVERLVIYHTVPASGGVDLPALLADGAIDAITFTSGSTVRYFVQRIGEAALEAARRTVIACIGPITADAAQAVGLPPTVVAETFSEAGLIEALLQQSEMQRAEGPR